MSGIDVQYQWWVPTETGLCHALQTMTVLADAESMYRPPSSTLADNSRLFKIECVDVEVPGVGTVTRRVVTELALPPRDAPPDPPG
jgi:hypothetical protein